MSDRRIYELLKHPFSKDEIRELGEALAREAQGVFDLKERKSSVGAALTAQIKETNGRVAELTRKINEGFELREVECMWMLEEPRPGMKRLMRTDRVGDEAHVRDEPMTQAEMQRSFGFAEGEDKRPEQ